MVSKVWLFAIPAPVVMLLGAYLAGGTAVVCTRVDAPGELAAGAAPPAVIGSCQVHTTRWFGRTVVEHRTYPRVTGVDRISEMRKDADNRRTLDWSFILMNDGRDIQRFGGSRKQVDEAYGKGTEWFGGRAGAPVTFDFTTWGFAFAAFGFAALWLTVLGLAARLPESGLVNRKPKARRVQRTSV